MNKFSSLSKDGNKYEFNYTYGLCDRGCDPPGKFYTANGVVRSRFLILVILKGWYRMLFYNKWDCKEGERKVNL